MPRSIDWRCDGCGRVDAYAMADVDETRACPTCGAAMSQDWLPRTAHAAQWDDSTAVLVHVDPSTGDVRYPGSHSAALKSGYERVYLRSLHEVDRFEREHNVVNHRMHYDSNGRALDDTFHGEKMVH